MEIKNNESTYLRPEGDRLMDAPMVTIDIPEFIMQLRTESTWLTSDRNAITVFKTNGFRIVLIALHEGAVMTEHIADGIISVQVLEGEISFSVDHKPIMLKPGSIVALHEGIHHTVKAVKESVFLLTLTTSLES